MSDIRNLTTRFNADATGFMTATNQVKERLTELNKDYHTNREAIKQNDKEIKNLEKTMSELSAEIKTSGDVNENLTTQYQQMGKELDSLKLKKAQLKTGEQDLKAKIQLTTTELKAQISKLKETQSQSEYTTKSLGNLGTALKALVFGYTGKKLYEVLIGSNAEMEQYITNFRVMLGSAEEAEKLVKDITKMAADTPFELPDLTETANMLMGYGVGKDDIIRTMTQLGDLSAGNADKLNRISLAYGQMLAKGKVTGEELRQMTEAGVPLLNALAESLEISTTELQSMISKGQVGIPELNKAISDLTSDGGKFSGMMSEQAQTMNGMLSTLRDNLSQIGRDVGEDAFATVKSSISEILSMVNEANSSGEIKKISRDLGSSLGAIANTLAATVKIAWEFRGAILAGTTAAAAYTVAIKGLAVIDSVKKALNGATVAQYALNTAQSLNPIGIYAALIAGLTASLVMFINYQTQATQAVIDCNNAMRETTERADENIANAEVEIEKMMLKVEIYENLRKNMNRTAEQEENLKQIAAELQMVMPNGIELIDQETGAYLNLSNAIGDVVERKKAEMQLQKIESQYETALNNREVLKAEMDSAKKRAESWKNHPTFMKDYGAAESAYNKNEVLIAHLEQEMRMAYNTGGDAKAIAIAAFGTDTSAEESDFEKKLTEEEFEEKYKRLQSDRNFDRITEEDYYNRLEKLLGDTGVTVEDENYEKYFLEIHQGRKKASGSSSLSKQVSSEKQELDEFIKESKAAYQESLDERKNTLDEYYKARKELADEEYKLSVEAIDNEISALEKSTNAKIKLIEKETDAEKEKLQLKMDAIDEEIEARKRLQEDTDINREIDVVKAKLTYSQLDNFSREEMEKELQRLLKQKEETEWQRNKADEKAALSEEMSSLDSDADMRKASLEAELEAEKEAAEIRKASLEEHRDNLISTLEKEKEALISALDTEQEKMEQTFTYIGDNFNSLAELHSSRIEDVFDVAVQRSKDAILELQSATNYASALAEQIIADIQAAKSSTNNTTYNNSKSATNNFYSSGLTPSQVESIVADALGD